MEEKRWSAVDVYFTTTIVQPDSALEAAMTDNAAAGLLSIDVSAPHGKFLYLLARISGTHRALEIGTLGGYSTIRIPRALPADGRSMPMSRGSTLPRGDRRPRRGAPRRDARQPADNRGRMTWAVRYHFHRRRQRQQLELSRLGAAALAAGDRDRGRQCRPERRNRLGGERRSQLHSACAGCSI